MLRVLIVEDDLPFAQALVKMDWARWDYYCVGMASNGKEALGKCEVLLPHIVLTDINMPVMDGLALIKALKARYPEIQVILLTVHEDFSFIQEALRSGAADYIVKSAYVEDQLGSAMGKATRPFLEGNGDLHARFLTRSARLLRLYSDADPLINEAEAKSFFAFNRGRLYGLKMGRAAPSAEALAQRLDHAFTKLGISPAMIIWDEQIAEIVLKKGKDDEWAYGLAQDETLGVAVLCRGREIASADDYWPSHALLIQTLELSFYEALPTLAQAQPVHFTSLDASVLEGWLAWADRSGLAVSQIEEYLRGQVIPYLYKERVRPEQVRSAFSRLLRRFELRYAETALTNAHVRIRQAQSPEELVGVLVEALGMVLPVGTMYSYQVRAALAYMEVELSREDLQLADVAAQVHMSPGYLSRKLKEETGTAFYELLIRMRMERAQALLRGSDRKVYEIAEDCGYSGYRSFVNAFINYFGVSPKQFR